MSDYKAPLADIRFLLHKVFKLEAFCSGLDGLDEVDTDTTDAILEEAGKICEQLLAPLDRSGDAEGAEFLDGKVASPKGFAEAYLSFSEGGWGALGGETDFGGMGMPKTLVSAVEEMVQGANMAFGLAPMLTAGACLSISAHGSAELKSRYLPKMYSGEWSGAMDLTEAHAGTDLGLMRTKAMPNDDGSFSLSGSKIFITWGEHDMTENIVHLVLAKLPDAPPGSRGISLFLVPKLLVNDDGSLAGPNGVSCGSIEHKMGIHGSPTCVMNFDNAQAWLIGEPHKGLACMFTMMNYERLVVGIQGVGVADNAYQNAKAYALDRLQGRAPKGAVQPEQAADPIIVHPDVRRMLLEMKSLNEGGRAFYIYVASWLDRAKYSQDADLRKIAQERVALLTPVAKAFLTDRALDACVHGQQVFGGHGYVQEWGQEQHVRDVRITQIYEGTNGVQAMDLIGRKTMACKGAMLTPYLTEMRSALEARRTLLENEVAEGFSSALGKLEVLTASIVRENEPDFPGSVAVDYLDVLGYCSYAYMWILMMSEADDSHFGSAKRKTGRFYFAKLLPQMESLILRIQSGSSSLSDFDDSDF